MCGGLELITRMEMFLSALEETQISKELLARTLLKLMSKKKHTVFLSNKHFKITQAIFGFKNKF